MSRGDCLRLQFAATAAGVVVLFFLFHCCCFLFHFLFLLLDVIVFFFFSNGIACFCGYLMRSPKKCIYTLCWYSSVCTFQHMLFMGGSYSQLDMLQIPNNWSSNKHLRTRHVSVRWRRTLAERERERGVGWVHAILYAYIHIYSQFKEWESIKCILFPGNSYDNLC